LADYFLVRRSRDADPWRQTILTYRSVEPWSVWLGR
jgi:hypothetical protein